MTRFIFYTLVLLLYASIEAVAGARVLTVPFVSERNRVIIPISVNGSKPLKILLDTGMGFDGIYLFHEEALALIDTTGAIEVRVPGAGSGQASTATMIETGHISFGDVTLSDQRVIVSRSAHTQNFPSDGVMGWNLFGHYIVEIDYDRELIFLRDSTYEAADSGWTVIPVEMRGNLPFFDMVVELVDGEVVPVTVYVDLASGEALELLVRDGQKFSMPDNLITSRIGTGLSGDISGSRGETRRVKLGGFELTAVRTAFTPASARSKQEGADGVLGNDFIRRFNIIFDYPHNRLLIRPNRTFDQPFGTGATD